MAKIRIAQIQDLSLTTTDGVSTITMGKTTGGALNKITPLTTVAQTTATEQTIDKVVVGLKVDGNSLVPVTETLANLHAGFVSETQLNQTLANYVTTQSLNTTLGGYYTSAQVDTKLADYYTSAQVDTKLADYYTSAQVDTKFVGYYTKGEIDTTLGNYVLKTDIATTISNDAVDTKVASEKAVKTYVDSKIQAADAMRYKGTVAAESDLPTTTNAVNGDTYKASTAFTLANGTKLEAGDMLIYNGTSWDVVQGNIDLASLTGATSDAANRSYAVKTNEDGNLVVTVDPLNITKDEHYTPTASEDTTSTGSVDVLNGGSFAIVTEQVDEKGHVIGKDTKTITVDNTALTERLEAIDEAITEASASASLVMKREVLNVSAGETPQTDLSEMPVGDVAITQNGLDLGIGEYTVTGVVVRFNLEVAAETGDVFVAYYMYNTEAQLPS